MNCKKSSLFLTVSMCLSFNKELGAGFEFELCMLVFKRRGGVHTAGCGAQQGHERLGVWRPVLYLLAT